LIKQPINNTTEGKSAKLTERCVDLIKMEDPDATITTLKSKKSPGSGVINNELYKHTSKNILHKLLNFLKYLLDLWRHT
jgi:hypothetical protein